MKIFYCFLISSLLAINFCQAQIPIKIKAGAARSNMRGIINWEAHPIVTWYGGVATTLPLGKRFFFQPELLYSRRGSNVESYLPDDTKHPFRYGYISMPLLLGWHPFKKMSVLLGAEPGYMVWDGSKGVLSEYTYEDVDYHFNVDLDLGLSYKPLHRWTVEARAMLGLIGLYEELHFNRISRTINKTGEYRGYHFMMQFGLCYDLKTK